MSGGRVDLIRTNSLLPPGAGSFKTAVREGVKKKLVKRGQAAAWVDPPPPPKRSGTTLRISFDDISFCRYRVIFKIS